ncbi:MAG: ASCH domain-containing protein [Candidatus Aenigmarchaeota archaeon]|nr:ASCH domain-containing protein [Candidatus Aenigmarchaeota archaeon]
MKTLKFSDPLPDMISDGKKNVTWRIDDEKGIAEEDLLSLCRIDGMEFAKAKVIKVKETEFGRLTSEDKKGHEEFSSEKKMYDTFSKYYRTKVTLNTKIKVIKFELL